MGDTNLLGVLKMPPKLWTGDKFDVYQRHQRYKQAADRIEELESALRELMGWNWLDESVSPPENVVKQCEKALS